jgi:hypothetical protein
MAWRLRVEMIEAKVFRTFIRLYSLFKSEQLSVNIKFTLHKAKIRFVMTYALHAWEFSAESYLLTLQRLQNKVFRTIGNLPRHILVRDMHATFKIPYVYDYISKFQKTTFGQKVISGHKSQNWLDTVK